MTYAKDFFIETFANRFDSTVELLDYLIEHSFISERTVEKFTILQAYPILRSQHCKCTAIRLIQKDSRLSEITIRNILNNEQHSFRRQR